MGDAARIFSVNYDATVRLVETVRPRMSEGGCAVLISSSSAYLVTAPEIDAAINELKAGEDSAALLKFCYDCGKRRRTPDLRPPCWSRRSASRWRSNSNATIAGLPSVRRTEAWRLGDSGSSTNGCAR
jgi:NAD(P)-dependent dehydrogenase (short-subunit alcohol dehydrogenase family)